jgi:transcriptional regulator with XRE-family HTH domain
MENVLRRAREQAGLTQRQVAARAGVTQPVVAAYESGRRQPTLSMLTKLLWATGHRLDLVLHPIPRLPDPERSNRHLMLALDLAEHLPRRARHEPLAFPRLPSP